MRPGLRRARLAGVSCLVVALVGLLVGIVVPSVAHASASNGHVLIDLGHGDGYTTSPHGTLLDMTRLAPGATTSGSMGVRNAYDGSSDLYLKFTQVSDHDGACAHPGESDCGGRHGQLGAELVFGVAIADSANGTYRAAWSGTAAQLKRGVAVIRSMPASTTRWVRLSATLPESSGNETQADRLGFGVQVVLQSGSGVDAVSVGPSSSGSGVLALAVTGASIGLFGVGAILLIGCGVLMLMGGRRRPRHGIA